MKKLYLILFLAILLVGTVSAADFDDIKRYDEDLKTYSLDNFFGLGKNIAEIELKTPTNNRVPIGDNILVAEIEFRNGEFNYEDIINGIELYDTQKEMKDVFRNIKYKYKTIIQVPNYESTCVDKEFANKSRYRECSSKEVGTKDKIVWTEFKDNSLLIGETITIGIFTNVKVGDVIEWVINVYGNERLTAWTTWDGDIDAGLVSYWSMDQSGSDVSMLDNSTNANHGNMFRTNDTNWVTGKVGGGFYMNGSGGVGKSSSVDITNEALRDLDQMTICFWLDQIEGNDAWIFGQWSGNFIINSENDDTLRIVSDGGGGNIFSSNLSGRDGDWNFICMNRDVASNNLSLWVDNTIVDSTTQSSASGFAAQFFIGQDNNSQPFAKIDEIGWWNRSLSATEINFLYGNGIGCAFGDDACGVITASVTNTLDLPADVTTQTNQTVNFSSTYVITPGTPDLDTIFQNSTLEVWFSNGTLHQTLFDSTFSSNITIFTIETLPFASYIWNINVSLNNSADDLGTNRTFSISRFTELLHTSNTTVFETSRQEFQVDIETIGGVQSVSAFLNYNATTYAADTTCTGLICNITATIDIPLNFGTLTYENKTFFWQITYFLGSSTETSNTTTKQQNVTAVNFAECDTFLPATKRSVNFTTHEETDLSDLNTDFNAFFKYYLGTGSVKKDGNSTGTGASTYDFCIDQNETFIVDSQIDLAATSFDSRHFNFIKELYTNTTRVQKLYLLNSTGSSNIIIEVKNQGLVPMKDILVNISRFYPGLGKYLTVEHQVTDEFGQIAAKLVENDVKYKFVFSNTENTVLKTSEIVSIVCRALFCIIPFVIEDKVDQFERMRSIDLYDTEGILFDTTTNIFTYSWNDQRGESTRTNLQVTRIQLNGSYIVCNDTTTSTLSSLSCSVGDSRASYKAQVFRTANGEIRRMEVLNIKVGDPADIYGLEGLFWVFILLMTMVGIGSFNPTVAMVLYGVGFIIMGTLGIISLPIPVFFANTIIVILFIWSINKR